MSKATAVDLSEHLPRIYRVALRIVGDREKAQDVVQEACLKALGGMEGFDGRASLATWLHRITVNCAMDQLRDGERGAGQRVDLAAVAAGLADTPPAAAERREMYHIAVALLAELPEDCRRAFVLTQLDGYSYDQAAAIEDQPRGTIASRVFRAKKMLLEQLSARAAEG